MELDADEGNDWASVVSRLGSGGAVVPLAFGVQLRFLWPVRDAGVGTGVCVTIDVLIVVEASGLGAGD